MFFGDVIAYHTITQSVPGVLITCFSRIFLSCALNLQDSKFSCELVHKYNVNEPTIGVIVSDINPKSKFAGSFATKRCNFVLCKEFVFILSSEYVKAVVHVPECFLFLLLFVIIIERVMVPSY